MFRNYITIAIRNLWSSKVFSLINIIGLSIGFASSFIMLLIVYHELSYDSHNQNLERVGKVLSEDNLFNFTLPTTSTLLANQMDDQFPEVEKAAQVYPRGVQIKIGDQYSSAIKAYCSDPDLFDILTIPVIMGEIRSLRSRIDWVLLSESLAAIYTKSKQPLGEHIEIKTGDSLYTFSVAAVFKDIPETSTFNCSIILPLKIAETDFNNRSNYVKSATIDDWFVAEMYTYFLLTNKEDFDLVDKNLEQLSSSVFPEEFKRVFKSQKLEDVYFESQNVANINYPVGDRSKIMIFTVIAILILIIASLNFIILSTARSTKRFKEIGIRKVFGASKLSITLQVIIEAVIISLLSLPLAVLLIEISLPELSSLLGITMSIKYSHSWFFYISYIIISVVVAVLGSLFLAVNLNRQNPISIFQRTFSSSHKGYKLRYAFIATQLIIFSGLVFVVIVIQNQIEYMKTTDLGFEKDNLLILSSKNSDLAPEYNAFKNEVLRMTGIANISAAATLPLQMGGMRSSINKNKNPDESVLVNRFRVHYDFIETMGLELVEGRDFSIAFSADEEEACIINEKALHDLELGDERFIKAPGRNVVGVVKDYHFKTMRSKIEPMFLTLSKNGKIDNIVIRLKGENLVESMAEVKIKSEEFYPDAQMFPVFYDGLIENLYSTEEKFGRIVNVFTGLAIFVTCLGLFGLTLFIAEQRSKEIGIRKVLGASVIKIITLVTRETIILVMVATIIATPTAYYFMSMWLDNFAYSVDIGIGTFVLSFIMAITITLVSVLIQSIKAATANPVNSLRDE